MARVPNTTTFTLDDVVGIVNPNDPGQPKIQQVYKDSIPVDSYVSCNGYGYIMYWNTNEEITLSTFVSEYGSSFGSVELTYTNGNYMTFTGIAGDDYYDASIDYGYVSTIQEVAQGSYLPDLSSCFTYANSNYFDATYSGSKNALYNFRNYGIGTTNTPFYFTDQFKLSLGGTPQTWTNQYGQGTQVWNFKTDTNLINNSSWGSGNIRIINTMWSNNIVFTISSIKVIRYNSNLVSQQEFTATGYSGQSAYNIDRTIACAFTSGSSTDRLGVVITTSTTTTTNISMWIGTIVLESEVRTFIQTN
jgi:hypothetical protein